MFELYELFLLLFWVIFESNELPFHFLVIPAESSNFCELNRFCCNGDTFLSFHFFEQDNKDNDDVAKIINWSWVIFLRIVKILIEGLSIRAIRLQIRRHGWIGHLQSVGLFSIELWNYVDTECAFLEADLTIEVGNPAVKVIRNCMHWVDVSKMDIIQLFLLLRLYCILSTC